jgi:uncharacterized protein GlcG (DUF336 family)
MNKRLAPLFFLLLPASGFAADIVPVKQISLELANTVAMKAVEACRKDGYNVSAVVLDRGGSVQVAMRDTLAAPHTLEIAERKAGASIMSGIASSEFRQVQGDIRAELNHIHGLIMIGGGLPIRAAGSLIGAVGVSGAPGSEKDEGCAAEAVKAVEARLEFGD